MMAESKGPDVAHLLVFEFPSAGPFGAAAVGAYRALAEDIAAEEGLVWKIWTEEPGDRIAGGVYLFESKADADRYVTKHVQRLTALGIADIDARGYTVNDGLSAITRGLAPS